MLKHHPPIPLILLLVAFFSTLLAATPVDYYIAGVDQTPNAVRVFPRNKPWTSSNLYWSFTAGKSRRGWSNLSDVKLRRTASHGWIALVCASGGNAGIIDVSKKNLRTDLGDLLWTGSPGSNPHAIERIPHIGAVVVASSTPGKLTLYYPGNPKKINDFKNLKRSSVNYDAPGAHGVLWDPNGAPDDPEKGILWVSLDKYMRKYKIMGRGKAMRLVREGFSIPFPGKGGMGHDLQPDYTNKNVLLATDSYGTYAYDISTAEWTTLREEKAIKSFVRHKSGEYLWVTKEGKDGWVSRWVSFGMNVGEKVSEKKGGNGMGFYKARVHDPAFE
ncbi:hypothetical protein BDBG_03319 [Blastomyces gilchristii SLH14081]|uniref:Uncharacterized protein n=1 Tax=Blastomyces gilchristii (strain SLH14081) TaxID=559298 RepID=A0A179ULF1_BLAGS|nr:uncharacterized protein BDBG_03319 [Blastomyces gilchristii SLH14081]OAT07232.1 hypothetical protein BDBG_03319 [Blastomyces gilchristii SLH14081]